MGSKKNKNVNINQKKPLSLHTELIKPVAADKNLPHIPGRTIDNQGVRKYRR